VVELPPVEWILHDAPLFNPQGDRRSAPRSGTVHGIIVPERLGSRIEQTPAVWFDTHRDAAEYLGRLAAPAS
jgi:hypothetical protein